MVGACRGILGAVVIIAGVIKVVVTRGWHFAA
jgi:hypothetical protein